LTPDHGIPEGGYRNRQLVHYPVTQCSIQCAAGIIAIWLPNPCDPGHRFHAIPANGILVLLHGHNPESGEIDGRGNCGIAVPDSSYHSRDIPGAQDLPPAGGFLTVVENFASEPPAPD